MFLCSQVYFLSISEDTNKYFWRYLEYFMCLRQICLDLQCKQAVENEQYFQSIFKRNRKRKVF